MLVYQGAASFELWTEQDAPLDIMFEAAREAAGRALGGEGGLTLQWALLGISIFVLILTYIVVQGTRAAMAWRTAAAAGDVKVIREIVQDSLDGWRSTKRPKTVAPEVWRGVQSLQIVEVRPDLVRVSCQAESEYKMIEGRSVETANPLQSGMATTARAMDMLMYELPHYKPERVQIDVYATFRERRPRVRARLHPVDLSIAGAGCRR